MQVAAGSPLVDASLESVVREAKPSVLLGLTGAGRLWDERVLTAMGESCERPMIGPLSNPTDRAECTAEVSDRTCVARSGVGIYERRKPYWRGREGLSLGRRWDGVPGMDSQKTTKVQTPRKSATAPAAETPAAAALERLG